MIEFPTDAKFSNMQVVPKSDKALFIKDAPFLKKTSDGQDWEIPDTFLPKDYERFTCDANFASPSASLGNDDGASVDSTSGELYLNVGGVYRFTFSTGSLTLDNSIVSANKADANNRFINNENGHEIVESLTQETSPTTPKSVYTIAPRVSHTSLRSITVGDTNINICSAAIVSTGTGTAKLVGTYAGTLTVVGTGSISTDGKITDASGTIHVTAGAGAVRITQSFTF